MDTLLRKKVPAWIHLRQIKHIAHCNFSVSLLNTNSFYHDLGNMWSILKAIRKFNSCCLVFAYLKESDKKLLHIIVFISIFICLHPVGIHLLKVNNENPKIMHKICSKLTIKTIKPGQWRFSGIFIVYFEYISCIVFVFPFRNLKK